MKRIIAIMLSLCLFFTTACANGSSSSKAPDDNYRNYYEIFVYSYYDENGDGIGDLQGVTKNLANVAELGCNGIWLMPIMPSTTYHKYDVIDYFGVDEEYGTLEDFDSLVNECHALDIRLIIDLVMNHTSSKHPWFGQACEYLATLAPDETMDASVCPYVDYYHFSKEKEGATWYEVPGSNYYYEAEFWSEMPDLNLASPLVQKEFEDIAKFWIDRGVDGFRIDAAMHFEENDVEFNTSTLNWYYEYCKSLNPDFYMVSEVWASRETIEAYYASNTPSMFDFSMADAEGDLIKTARGKESAEKFVNKLYDTEKLYKEAYSDYINAPFITNHDMGRVANALVSNEDDIKFAGGLLMSMGGSPFVYYGEELGMKSKGNKDENKRLAYPWGVEEGVCVGPKDADSGIEQTFESFAVQKEDEGSIYNYYKKAINLRNECPEIARGELEIVDAYTEGDVAVCKRLYGDKTLYIVYNTSNESVKINTEGLFEGKYSIISTISVHNEDASSNGGELTIPMKSIVYIRN